MDAASIIAGMAENNAWANHRLLKACALLSRADYHAERTSFFPSLHGTLSHILTVDWFYVDALEGGTLGYAAFDREEPFETLAALAAAQRAVDVRLVRLAQEATESSLDAPVTLRRPTGDQAERAGDVLLHLFEHQIHHRGQAHAMLAGTPVRPPPLDEYFLVGDRPLREAELRELGLRVR